MSRTIGGASRGVGVALAVLMMGSLPAQGRQNQSKPQQHEQPLAPVKPAEAARTDAAGSESLGVPVDLKSYIIGPEDILFIKVWREADFTGPQLVRPDGRITLPLVGDLQAGGLTPERLSTQIAQALSEMINNPQVSVTVNQVNSKKFYITGEVNRTGAFPLVVPTTVLDALGQAGGFRDFANKKNIRVLRQGKTLKFNYNDVIKGKRQDQNIVLENGDHIIVP